MLAINRVSRPFSCQLLMPATAGTPRYEYAAGCWQRLCAICATSPPPGFRPLIGVRGMLSIAGMRIREIGGIPRHYRSRATLFSYQSRIGGGKEDLRGGNHDAGPAFR